MPIGRSHCRNVHHPPTQGQDPVDRARMTRVLAACMLLSMSVTMGCRSAAQQDVYNEKMAGRIRVLEDRLNEAEYQNHVLRQELSRAESSQSASRFGDDSRSGSNRSRGATGSGLNRGSQSDGVGTSFELGSPIGYRHAPGTDPAGHLNRRSCRRSVDRAGFADDRS